MGPELALAITSCVEESTSILASIYKTIKEVVQYKKNCEKLGREVYNLKNLLDTRSSAIKDLETVKNLLQCFKNTKTFVDQCKNLDFFHVTWQVVWKKDYPALLKRISTLREAFLFEGVAEILAREEAISQGVTGISRGVLAVALEQRTQGHTLNQIKVALNSHDQTVTQAAGQAMNVNLSILSEVKALQRNFTATSRAPSSGEAVQWHNLDASLRLTDNLQIVFEDDANRTGKASLEGEEVVCYKIESTNFTQAALKLYQETQRGAFVQNLHGVARADGDIYAVMDPVFGDETLADAIARNTLPPNILDRLQLAYDVAKSMAWFHRAEMKLKSHSDDTIVLKSYSTNSKRRHAVMTRLEGARHFLEQTSGISYDLRYEAFEYDKLQEHSKYTDVYSLGTIIWQIVCSEFPYGIKVPVNNQEQTEYSELQNKLVQKESPGTVENIPPRIASLVGKCWQTKPQLRPSSIEVAQTLENLINEESSREGSPDVPSDDDHEICSQSSDILKEAFKLIQRAKEVNLKSATILPTPGKITTEDFKSLMEGSEWSGVKFFVVGAVILWKLTDFPVEKLDREGVTWLDPNSDAERAQISLFYLEAAVTKGYTEVYFEMYKAHAALARELKGKSEGKS